MKNFILIAFILLISCKKELIKKNDAKDLSIATEKTNKFYANLKKIYIENIYENCDKSLNIKDIKDVVLQKDSILGDVLEYKIKNINTINTKIESIQNIDYIVEVLVTYEKGSNLETLNFSSSDNNLIILKSYDFKPSQGNVSVTVPLAH